MATPKGNEPSAPRRDARQSQDDDSWPTTARAPSSGASIKDFSLQAFLGEGSTAHVYMATRVGTHEQVAIKVIDKLLVRQANLQHKIQREILLHSPLRHRHVVRVYEAFEDPRNHYLVLEHCEGGSVASLVRSLRGQGMTLDETTAKSIFRQTALGVAYLHARGIIHRDLKLSNLLLTGDDEVKISDFGLATLMSEEHATVCGTPNFIAPEVLSAADDTLPYDETVDIWSLGCILYTLLLGKPPFEGVKVSDTLLNVSNAGHRPLHLPRGFSATIGDLITRMLNRDAASRPTVAQVLAHPWLRVQMPKNDQVLIPESLDGDESDEELSSELSEKMEFEEDDELSMEESYGSDISSVIEAATHKNLPTGPAAWRTSQVTTGSATPPDVHFLHLRVEVSNLPFLGISSDDTCEITLDCWETSDIRQLARFVLRVGDKEIEYTPSHGLIQGLRPDGSHVQHVCAPPTQSTLIQATSSESTNDDDQERIIRLCQCLAARALQLRQAAMTIDVENLPMVHYDRLPQSLLDSLRRESVRSTLTRELGQLTAATPEHDSGLTRCAIQGVGLGEFDSGGRLIIHFFSGPTLQMNASGSKIRYRRSPTDEEDEFDLAGTPFLPTEVKKHFEHVAAFVRQLKSP